VRFPTNAPGGFVEVDAFAKINLFLDVVGKRDYGYHEIESVMQRIELHDSLTITQAGSGVELVCNDLTLPVDDSNLVMKAAKFFLREYKLSHPVRIELTKRVPMGAGLGGGSSDAAATLLGLNELFGLGVTVDKLAEMGTKLGADVPFCVLANSGVSAAIATGIGEKLQPLHCTQNYSIVLACPNIHVSTAEIFSMVKIQLVGNSDQLKNFAAIYETGDATKIAKNFYNFFTDITGSRHPLVLELIGALRNEGAMGAEMTGTGSTVFGVFENAEQGHTACMKLGEQYSNVQFLPTRTL